MKFKLMDAEGLRRVYADHMVYDFPKEELKPLFVLEKCMREGSCRLYGLFDGDSLAAYAVMLFARPHAPAILDYLAAVRTMRGQGAGSEMLKRLRETLTDVSGILIEYEFPDDAPDDAEKMLRERRESFYLRNGMRRTALDLILFGVHFCVGYIPVEADLPDGVLKRGQIAVYDAVNCWDYHFRDSL